MYERQHPEGAPRRDEARWAGQRGIEGIEVALITGMIVVIILATVPLVSGGIQAAITAAADELMNAGSAIN